MEQSIIDIHSHILFGVDDGAKNIEESITLLRQAGKTRNYRYSLFKSFLLR